MDIAPELLKEYFLLNEGQRAIVSHQEGPLLAVAGPGSGKTRSLVFLALNLLVKGNAQPAELMLCTYTEKAAHDMRDRLMRTARDVNYTQDLAQMRIGTIHGLCKQLIDENIHHTAIENDFTTLDQFTQQLLIVEEIEKICTPAWLGFWKKRWGSLWDVAKELASCFDKITEELIFDKLKQTYAPLRLSALKTDKDRLRYGLTYAYKEYQRILKERNCLDFAHLQKCVYNLLCDAETSTHLTKGIRYVLVDEYQDTNTIQEQILTRLASASGSNNLFVVGDEDQALYRFRGATVRNILEFAQKHPGCKQVQLLTNYRSHQTIIDTYNRWIAAIDWSQPQGLAFRTEKKVVSNKPQHENYPAVCTMIHANTQEEAEQFAELVASLMQQQKITDYSQVVLLLYSVKPAYSNQYMQALQRKNIPYTCPRAESAFAPREVCLMIGCFARILNFEEKSADLFEVTPFSQYLSDCKKHLQAACLSSRHLNTTLFNMQKEIMQVEVQGKPLMDYFYRLLTVNPFLTYIKDDNKQAAQPQNLENLSQLLQTFQRFYHYAGITQQNRAALAHDFFQKFLYLLYNKGLNQSEIATEQALPSGRVPILTIHQAKGLEFRVVVVGQMNKLFKSSDGNKQHALQDFSAQPSFEPVARIADFDLYRLYYVAFSRAKSLLILTAVGKPELPLVPLWQHLPLWSDGVLASLKNMPPPEEISEPFFTPQSHYGFTSHIQLYKTCPRQFQFFRDYKFVPSQSRTYFSGQLIHHTLEHIHRIARDGELAKLDERTIHEIFERKFQALVQLHLAPIETSQKNNAWQQILRYFQQNQDALRNIEAAELHVQVDRNSYVLAGTIDLLIKTPHGLDLIDFKTLPRQEQGSRQLAQYEQQLHFYAHALEKYSRKRPDRLFIYWTAEECREDALLEIPYQAEDGKKIYANLDLLVANIEKKNFHVGKDNAPALTICKVCDIRYLCQQDRVIDII